MMYPHLYNQQEQQQHQPDDESVLSGMYTESGDYSSSFAQNTLDTEDDDEAFRSAVQAEQERVMREFGITDVISVESYTDNSIFADSSFNSSLPAPTEATQDKKNSTPETYDEAYDDNDDDDEDDDEDASTFHPNTLFPSKDDPTQSTYAPLLTPRRLKMTIALLCLIFVSATAVAMGSFLAQKEGRSEAVLPDLDQLATTIPISPPTTAPSEAGDCIDHPNVTFFINEEFGDQNCAFLQSHLDQRARLCLSEKDGYRWCPVTCDLCTNNNHNTKNDDDYGDMVPSLVPTPSMTPSISEEFEIITIRPTAITVTRSPTLQPTARPTSRPTAQPITNPTKQPISRPTSKPTSRPTRQPTSNPTTQPISNPTTQPTFIPTVQPTRRPTAEPSADPTAAWTMSPTFLEDTTAAPTSTPSSSFLCRVCPFFICRLLPCE